MSNEIKGIVFDMDGVILDSETICDQNWIDAAKEFNIEMTSYVHDMCRGCNYNDIVVKLKNHYGADFDVEAFLERTGVLFSETEFSKGIPLMPYAKEALEYLSSKYTVVLASSTPGPTVERQLTNTGVVKYFKTRTTGEMVKHSKPDPEIYLLACKSVGLKPEECVGVEDSFNGIKSSAAAGLKTVMIPDKVQPTDEIKSLCWKICKNLKELTQIL